QLQWSSDPNAMKFVFVAGNEEFDQGPITAATAMKDAAAKDISVQLIFCGSKDETWERAAKLAQSDLMTIDQNQVAQHIPAPQDDEILALGQQLNSTYVAYGAEGGASMQRQQEADASSAKMSKKVAVERAQLKSKKSYDNRGWDVVDATVSKPKFLEETKDEYLPAEMRGKTLEEKKQIVAAKTAEREQLKLKIAKLETERATFIDSEKKKQNLGAEQSLETELMKSTKKIAEKKGYK
nr:hypothetical protein [Deltaproteobacteria bacterium]